MSAPASGRLGVHSETGPLGRVVVFAPGAELDRMLPVHIDPFRVGKDGALGANPDYLLFDDLVLRDTLASEHAALVAVLRATVGPAAVHDLGRLLVEVLEPRDVRAEVVAEVLELEQRLHGGLSGPWPDQATLAAALLALPVHDLGTTLQSGAFPDGGQALRWPMPNWLFARDCLAVVADAVLLGWPRHRARARDGVLARAICRHHRLLQGLVAIDVTAADSEARIEGGDVMVVADDLVLIGIGIRTNRKGASAAAAALRGRRDVSVLGVELPRRRAAMHLDTLLTFADVGVAVGYRPALDAGAAVDDRLTVLDLLDGDRVLGHDLLAILADRGHPQQLIACGGDDALAAAREQWTDGANAFCLGPGKIVLYGRNAATLRALNRCDFEVLSPEAFVRNAARWLRPGSRCVVALEGYELSRGRGGPRCLTLPLARSG